MEEVKRKYEQKKLNVEGKTWHLEFMFDAPIIKEYTFNDRPVNKAVFAFIDLDDGVQFTAMLTEKTVVVGKLKDYRKGDRIDMTYKSFVDKLGVPKHFYDIMPYGSTPHLNGPIYKTPETTIEIGNSEDGIDLASIEF